MTGKFIPNTLSIIIVVVTSFTSVLSFGVVFFANDVFLTELQKIDVQVGAANFKDVATGIIAPYQQAILTSADVILYAGLIGLCLSMIVAGYMNRKSMPLMIIAEFGVLLIILAFAMLFSYAFGEFISVETNVANPDHDPILFFQNSLALSSGFVQNLPLYVLITGLGVILVSYVLNRRKTQEEEYSAGTGEDELSDIFARENEFNQRQGGNKNEINL